MSSDALKKPLACWRGKERYDGGMVECLTIIFRVRRLLLGPVPDVQLPV